MTKPAAAAEPGPAPDVSLLHPVRSGNAFEETVERLLQTIRLGVVPPGGRLPAERELATRLGVSRATLREALGELHEAGWVEVRRGRAGGTFVRPDPSVDLGAGSVVGPGCGAPLSPGELDDVLTFRWVVEVGAAEMAAGRDMTAAARRELATHLAAVRSASHGEYRRFDSRLHLALAEATGSRSLVRAVADAKTQVNMLLDRIPLLSPNLGHSNEQHREIVQAVLAGNAPAARSAMIDHLEGTAALLRGFLA